MTPVGGFTSVSVVPHRCHQPTIATDTDASRFRPQPSSRLVSVVGRRVVAGGGPSSSGSVGGAKIRSSLGQLSMAVSKSQIAVYDGSEFVSLAAYLHSEEEEEDKEERRGEEELPSAGFVRFVVGMTDADGDGDGDGDGGGDGEEAAKEKKRRIIGVAVVEEDGETKTSTGDGGDNDDHEGGNNILRLDANTRVYADSTATIPPSVSDADAIATAAASLVGIHCGLPSRGRRTKRKSAGGFSSSCGTTDKVVVLGGGDYACFTAKGLSALGATVSLVTSRPMALKDTFLNPLAESGIDCMGPAIGTEEFGFSEALGKFDVVVDTLGDDAGLGTQARTYADGRRRSRGERGVSAKLKKQNSCDLYISTLTRSQQFVLDDGLLFARDPVIKYQKRVEKKFDPSKMLHLVPPKDFGPGTLQKLFDAGVVFPSDKNENGDHKKKDVFVRGWSFPDYTEIGLWPRDSSSGGAGIRFGFPAAGELALEAAEDEMMATLGGGGGKSQDDETKKKSTEKKKDDNDDSKKPRNPYVTTICDLTELREEIVEKKRTCLLFVSASYCRICKTLTPGYTRMARLEKEGRSSSGGTDERDISDTVVYAKANTASKAGKQMSFSLQVDSVPTFILFKDGERYGEPLGVTKLPSEKLELAVEYLRLGKEWDPEIFKEDEAEKKSRTMLT